MPDDPLVTIGIPVYQGENYLDETLRAARSQDYPNLEILVYDNASTDATQIIAKSHAAEDERVRLVVQDHNVGAAQNYNDVFSAADGEFFAWNAHDDLSSPDFVASGVRALQGSPDALVALAELRQIDESGNEIGAMSIPEEVFSGSPSARFLAAARAPSVLVVFGLFRRAPLHATRLHQKFTGSDRNFVAEAMLLGRAVRAGDSKFYLREHPDRSVLITRKGRFRHAREGWFDPEREGRVVFPNWRRLGGYLSAVVRAGLGPVETGRSLAAVGALLADRRFRLMKAMGIDLMVAARTLLAR